MVIAGKIRGNAPQLGRYLFTPGNNERITILHLDGREDVTPEEFKDFLYSVELNSELTRSSNSAYHAYINPNPEDTMDRVMTKAEWYASVDTLTKHLKYEDQRHGVVLHDLGKGRVHAHIVYERYNHERGTMATYEQNYKAHDRARAEMEQQLNHKPTPQKNKNRDHHKQTLTAIWQRTNTADAFIKEAESNGYKIAKGTDRPFRVIDNDGVSFDLVRKLDGVKTSDVRQRFGDTALVPEKEAIRAMQSAKQERKQQQPDEDEKVIDKEVAEEAKNITTDNEAKSEIEKVHSNGDSSAITPAPDTAQAEARQKFLQNLKDIRERNRSLTREITMSFLIALRVCFSFKGNTAEQRATLKQQFAVNTIEINAGKAGKPPEQMLGFIEAAQFYKPT